MRSPDWRSLALALLVTLAALVIWHHSTPVDPCGPQGDCAKYSDMARAFRQHAYHAIETPFNGRIAAPWLVARLPDDNITTSFIWLNSVSFLIFVCAWFLIARQLSLSNAEFGFLLAWFLVHPLGFAFYFRMPEMVDPLTYALSACAIYCHLARRYKLFLACILIGLLAKESFLFILLIAVLSEQIARRVSSSKQPGGFPLVWAALLVFLAYKGVNYEVKQHLFPSIGSSSISATIQLWLRESRRDPTRLIVWWGSLVCATGMLAALLPHCIASIRKHADVRTTSFLLMGAAGSIILGLLGGADMSRIIFNGNVFVFALVFFAAKQMYTPRMLACVLAGSIALALIYPVYFPVAFEYAYYRAPDDVLPPLIFALSSSVATAGLGLLGRKTPT